LHATFEKFNEGFATPDLVQAQAQLQSLTDAS
jgi:hypothetical protein